MRLHTDTDGRIIVHDQSGRSELVDLFAAIFLPTLEESGKPDG